MSTNNMTKEKKQGDKLFNLLVQIVEHNKKYNTTYNLVQLDRKEYNKYL